MMSHEIHRCRRCGLKGDQGTVYVLALKAQIHLLTCSNIFYVVLVVVVVVVVVTVVVIVVVVVVVIVGVGVGVVVVVVV